MHWKWQKARRVMEMKDAEIINLIKRNSAEVFTEEELDMLLKSGKTPSAYLGRAITGPLHVGHLVSLSIEEQIDLQRQHYTEEEERQYGVVGIHIKLVS